MPFPGCWLMTWCCHCFHVPALQVHNQEMTLAAAGAWYRISLFSVTTQLINVIANVITRQ